MDGHGAGVAGVGVAPYVFQQLLGGVHAFAVTHQELQELKLLGLQADRLVMQRDLAGSPGEGQLAGFDHVAGRSVSVTNLLPQQLATTQHGLHARHEFPHGERLGHVVVGADLETDHAVDFIVAGRQHQQRHSTRPANLAAHVEAVHAGKHEVQHHQVRLGGERQFKRAFAVGGRLDLVALASQVVGDGAGQALFVLDDQDPGQGVSPRARHSGLCLQRSTIRRAGRALQYAGVRAVQRIVNPRVYSETPENPD